MPATRLSLRFGALLAAITLLMSGLTLVMPAQPADAAVQARPGTKLFGLRVIAEARKHNDKPYVWGSTGPRSFDCSGFTSYVIKRSTGKKLPRTSRQQYAATKRIAKSQVRPGDLIFLKNSSGRVYHVSIYAGGGRVWHATNPRTDVRLTKLWTNRWYAGRVR